MSENAQISLWRRFLELCIPYLAIKRRGEDESQLQAQDKRILKRALPGWQIFLIAVGGVIGITIFSTHGEILRLAGPAGLLVTTVFVALTMICVMECLGELVQMWPVSNAMVEYVRVFVDEDFAVVVGIAYWYGMSCVFSTLIVVAANLASWTIESDAGRGILFYGVVPSSLVLINVLGVEYYGFVEGVGGIIKIFMVLTGVIFMIVKAPPAHTTNLKDGFQNQDHVAASKFEAICVAIPLISYGYIGTEIVSVASFEAIDRRSLRFPARTIAYIIAFTYVLSALLQSFLVNYTNDDLQKIKSDPVAQAPIRQTNWPYAIMVLIAQDQGLNSLAKFFNGCIIYFCISAANTALYAASRTLFGLTRDLDKNHSIFSPLRYLRHLGAATPTRQIPLFALLFSAIAFYWVIPLGLSKGFGITNMLIIMSTTASIGVLIAWGSQCLAFIRYYRWLAKFRDLNTADCVFLPPKYNRWEPQPKLYDWHAHRMLLTDLKLIPAVIGLVNCFAIVFVLSSANWWIDGRVNAQKLATAYAGPITLFLIFVFLKSWNRRWWVVLPTEPSILTDVLADLERSSNLRHVTQGSGEASETRSDEEQNRTSEVDQVPIEK